MEDKKPTIFQNPLVLSTAISGILSAVVSVCSFGAGAMKIINVAIPPISIILSYILAWVTAKFYTLSVPEQPALSKMEAREKRIRKDLKAGGISPGIQKKLEKELDDIVWEKSQIGKAGSIVSESHFNN